MSLHPRFGYTGQEYDAASETYNYKARQYDPANGRFLSQDPAREGSNWYAYVGNNPLNLIDSTGLAATFAGTGAMSSSFSLGYWNLTRPTTWLGGGGLASPAAPVAFSPAWSSTLLTTGSAGAGLFSAGTGTTEYQPMPRIAASAHSPVPATPAPARFAGQLAWQRLAEQMERSPHFLYSPMAQRAYAEPAARQSLEAVYDGPSISAQSPNARTPMNDPDVRLVQRVEIEQGGRVYSRVEALAYQRALANLSGDGGAVAWAQLQDAAAEGLFALGSLRASAGAVPSQTQLRMAAGRSFDTRRSLVYPYNQIYVQNTKGQRFRLDSYNPQAGEIVSRKNTQFHEIEPSTGVAYVREAAKKYAPGSIILDVPSSGGLAGSRLEGRVYLEVPVQSGPIPQKVIDAANRADVLIRDVDGKVYNKP